MKLPVIVIGAGGHAKGLLETLLEQGINVLGFTDAAFPEGKTDFMGVPVLGTDEIVSNYAPQAVQLVNGVGSVQDISKRKDIFVNFKQLGFNFAEVIHRTAVVSGWTSLGEGVQLMAGAVVQPGSSVGDNTIINTKTAVDHDCLIGSHVHLSPGVTLSGGVEVGEGVHIGTGATVIQGIRIGAYAFVAAGAVVVRDVPAGARVMGVPAKIR
ncbi:MAG: acetyltransferase [Desulfitobacteriaceae bacterium]|nr:acetyltransferase [Desulfitobacteriaceae bacterium]MDI6912954.1 acetyltransferase [Desulfitobacteriaceae bacterium]